MLLGKTDTIGLEDLPRGVAAAGPLVVEPLGSRTLKEALEGPERQIILEVLESNHWNRFATAEVLGINRTTLYKKMKRLGLEETPLRGKVGISAHAARPQSPSCRRPVSWPACRAARQPKRSNGHASNRRARRIDAQGLAAGTVAFGRRTDATLGINRAVGRRGFGHGPIGPCGSQESALLDPRQLRRGSSSRPNGQVDVRTVYTGYSNGWPPPAWLYYGYPHSGDETGIGPLDLRR